MSTIKISELNEISQLNANTSNTVFVGVDIPSGLTGKISATTLSRSLYAYNPLIVGNNLNLFPNTISQFSGNSITYLQSNLQNFTNSGSGDYIITADTGTNSNYGYNDVGFDLTTLDISLTPTSSTSKILILTNINLGTYDQC